MEGMDLVYKGRFWLKPHQGREESGPHYFQVTANSLEQALVKAKSVRIGQEAKMGPGISRSELLVDNEWKPFDMKHNQLLY